jgi:hypothetical protein
MDPCRESVQIMTDRAGPVKDASAEAEERYDSERPFVHMGVADAMTKFSLQLSISFPNHNGHIHQRVRLLQTLRAP